MAIKQIGIRQQGGGYTYSDIGANSANIDVPNGGSTQSLDAALLAINTKIDTNKTNADTAIATKATINHADATGAAGKGTAANFGHVKMGAGINTAVDGVVAVAYGTDANTACQGNDSRLSDKRTCPNALTAGSVIYDGSEAKTITAATLGAAPTNHASTGTTYGVGDASNYGHVKAGTGILSTSGVLSTNYGTAAGTACQGNDARLSDARTPVSHATSATTYGIGNSTNYGHVKVSDVYATSDGTASQGVSASSYAVNQAYNELNSKLIDYVVEQRSTPADATAQGSFLYKKWSNGFCSLNLAITTGFSAGVAWLGGYYHTSPYFQFPFVVFKPKITACLQGAATLAVHCGTEFYYGDPPMADESASAVRVYIHNGAPGEMYSTTSGVWDFQFEGRWKA